AAQPIDLFPRLAPVDLGVVRSAAALVSRLGFVLFDARRLSRFDQVDGLQHRLDPHRKQAIEIDGSERVSRPYRRTFRNKSITGIEPIVGPENRKSGFFLALDDRPIDGAGAAIG